MSHGKTALTLMMALALPGAAQALGLGEIHLDSALNEPLVADIDIVGATAEELAGVTASIANRETFQHFGVDRPDFLSTIAFKISRDSRGRAVLAIRSTDACPEPLLNMLVDLRWRGGELIRQYTLLLDPPGFPSATPNTEAVVGALASYAAPVSVRPAVTKALIETPKPVVEAAPGSEKASTVAGQAAARKTVRVGAKATLRGVAWRVGSRSEADLKRMMIAIFRANPHAFEGNINQLRRGAMLTIPSAIEVSAISVANADHEVRAQMQAWHASTLVASPTKSAAPAVAAPVSLPGESAVPSPPAAGSAESAALAPAGAANVPRTAAESAAPAETALDRRVQQMERGLAELRDQFDREHDALVRAQARLTLAEKAPAAVAPPQANSGRGIGSSIAAVLALAAAAFGIYAWRRRRALESQLSPAESELQNLVPGQVAVQGAMCEAVACSTQVGVEPRAVRVEPRDVPHETHDALSSTPLSTRAGERQWVADAVARRGNGVATESSAAANPHDAVDVVALEVSYLLQGSGGGLDDTVNLGDTDETARLPATVKLCVDDPSAETTSVETARMVGIPESTTRGPRVPGNAMPANKPGAEATKLDYNLLDLDATVQHVQMPSALDENVGFKERRSSLVDVLKSAVEREPHRRDLRMKLLETYYAAAAMNRQGFLDIVQKIADERASLNEGEWDKIAWMGRQIASDDDLFAPIAAQPDEEDLANCA
jgi:pilus assembly protein FimV